MTNVKFTDVKVTIKAKSIRDFMTICFKIKPMNKN